MIEIGKSFEYTNKVWLCVREKEKERKKNHLKIISSGWTMGIRNKDSPFVSS